MNDYPQSVLVFSPTSQQSLPSFRPILSPLQRTPLSSFSPHTSSSSSPRIQSIPSISSTTRSPRSRRHFISPVSVVASPALSPSEHNNKLDTLIAVAFAPNKFQAPVSDDDDDEDDGSLRYGSYRDQHNRQLSDMEDEDTEETKHDREDEAEELITSRIDKPSIDWLDLSNLLLQMKMNHNENTPDRETTTMISTSPQPRTHQNRRTERMMVPESGHTRNLEELHSALLLTQVALTQPSTSSALTSATPLETSIAHTLQQLQQQYQQEAQSEVDETMSALEESLEQQSMTDDSSLQASNTAASYLASVRSSIYHEADHTREDINKLISHWQNYHQTLQHQYQQHLQTYLAEQKRQKEKEHQLRLEQEAREQQLKEQQATAAAEAARQQKLQQEREEQKRKEAEEQRMQQEKQAAEKQKQAEQQQLEEQKHQLASASKGESRGIAVQQVFGPHLSQSASTRSLAQTFSGPNKVQHKILINRTINQISQTLASIRTKATVLIQLAGSVKQSGSVPEYAFVIDTMAERLVAQGNVRVRDNPPIAFAFAAIILNLSIGHPHFLSCFLTYLVERSIYIVPHYPARKHYNTAREYMLALGYEEVSDTSKEASGNTAAADGSSPGMKWEDESSFFARHGGYISLYVAFMQLSTPQHPWPISHGWSWLGHILNHPPRSITSTLLTSFLTTAGYALYEAYQSQIPKVFHHLMTEYLPKIQHKANSPARVAAMNRLALWLNNTIQYIQTHQGRMEEPEGRTMVDTQSQNAEQQYIQEGDDRGI